MLCKFCDRLSISGLIELAEIEFSALYFPREAYYQHHASYADLVSSANGGCELCELIHQGFIETVVEEGYWNESTLDEAVQGIESEGLSTDLKICINTLHLYDAEKLERVKLFDTILVQAGDPRPYDGSLENLEESRDWSISDPLVPLSLEISVPRGKSRFVRNFEVGRYDIDPELGSSQNHRIAKGWLEECCALHEGKSQYGHASRLPTRVIDVGDLNGSRNPRLFLSEMTEDKYAALSHCWGGAISPLLTTENLESFQESIPYCDLPTNFRDAISITRLLGIRFLWIDSLCIIQNSRLDWETESKKMCSIYRDALLTISASASPGSTYGIFKSNPLPDGNENEQVTLKVYEDCNLSDTVCISRRQKMPEVQHENSSLSDSARFYKRSKKAENLDDLFGNFPLSQRGWTLQEGLLSPRILYYGKRQIYWKCPHGFQSADGMPSVEGGYIMPPDTSTFPRITSIIHQHLYTRPGTKVPQFDVILEDYYWLVGAYTSRRLTFESDKLPAFSGIVELLHPTIGGEYLAGLWSRDLAQGLSWYQEIGACKHVETYRAPSWSWVVTDDPVLFYQFDLSGKKTFSDVYDVQIVSWNVRLKTESKYGQIESAQLILRGWTKDLVRSKQEINSPFEESTAYVYYDEPEDELGNYATSSLFNVNSDNGDYFLSALWSHDPKQSAEEVEIDFDMFSEFEHTIILIKTLLDEHESIRVLGLALRRLEGDGTRYERVGFIVFHSVHSRRFYSWITGWTQQTITLI